jgi:hypothetical protein
LFAARIDLSWRDKSAADLESIASANADYLETNSRIATAVPTLRVNHTVPFAGDLAIIETVAPKFFRQWLVETAFFTPTLNRSAPIPTRWRYQTADKRPTAFLS